MLSTTSITLAPGCRWMFRMMAGTALAHAASFEFSAAFSTVATSARRTGEPLRYAMMRFLYSAGDFSWSLASMLKARVGPSKLPLGALALLAETDVRRSSRFRP